MSRWSWLLALVLMGAVLLAAWIDAQAVTLTFWICDGYTLSRRGDDVLVRCPNKPDPVFTFRNCKTPIVKRLPDRIVLTCA